MEKSKHVRYKIKDFNAGELGSAIRDAISAANLKLQNFTFRITVKLSDDSSESRHISLEDIWSILDLRNKTLTGVYNKYGVFTFVLYSDFLYSREERVIVLNVYSEHGEQITNFLDKFQSVLNLEQHIWGNAKDTNQLLINKKSKPNTAKSPAEIAPKRLLESTPTKVEQIYDLIKRNKKEPQKLILLLVISFISLAFIAYFNGCFGEKGRQAAMPKSETKKENKVDNSKISITEEKIVSEQNSDKKIEDGKISIEQKDQSEILQKESNITVEPVLQEPAGLGNLIEIIPIESRNVEELIGQLRKKYSLRELTALESGQRLSEIPNNTFCFIHIVDLEFLYRDSNKILGKIDFTIPTADRYNTQPAVFFEIHKYQDNKYYIIVFISGEVATFLSQSELIKEKDFMAFPKPLQPLDCIAIIPMNRIIKLNRRQIQPSEIETMGVLDLRLK